MAIATAEHNNCTYCLSVHTCIEAYVAKVDAEELERARHAESAEPHAAAVPALSDAIPRRRPYRRDAAQDGPGREGHRRRDRRVVGNLALNILTKYFKVLADTGNEGPVVTRTPTADRRALAWSASPRQLRPGLTGGVSTTSTVVRHSQQCEEEHERSG
ncbi:hypothetical protein ACFV2N_38705 [Streptomyces sp. NPDC059680]|uniref:hypothetical protein n=1 Tax=Streptomyces sp. NPDC059680 TaxID=3346904 RepID=UPI00369E4278